MVGIKKVLEYCFVELQEGDENVFAPHNESTILHTVFTIRRNFLEVPIRD